MDHVCKCHDLTESSVTTNLYKDEKQLVMVFLSTIIDKPDFTCADMNTVFFPCGNNRMQFIFDQLPGMQLTTNPPKINPGFAGLEQDINAVKGYVGYFYFCRQI